MSERPSQPTDDDPDPADMADARVELIEAFYHPRFGVVLWHDYVDDDGSFVMSAKLNDESRAQAFVDEFVSESVVHDKPAFSAN